MFTFEDLKNVDPAGIQTLMRVADKDKMTLALKAIRGTKRLVFF